MELTKLDLKGFFFISILIILGWVMLQLFAPYLNVIVVALVIVQLFYPLYKTIHKYIPDPNLASLCTTLVTIALVVLPILFAVVLTAKEVTQLVQGLNLGNVSTSVLGSTTAGPNQLQVELDRLISSVNSNLTSLGITAQLSMPNITSLIYTFLSGLESRLVPIANELISTSFYVLFVAFIFFITLFYSFKDYHKLPGLVSRISPLDDQLDELLFRKFTETNQAVIRGSFLVALAQASAVSVALIAMGIGAPVLLWVIMVFLSLIPVGSGFVWFPAGIYLIASGQPIAGIGLILYSAIIINLIDTTLRPWLLKDSMRLHPMVIIFSALGGISLFGPLGLLYGPLVVVFFTSLMDVYSRRYAGTKRHH